MFTKDQFIDSIENETQICKHLFSKIPDGSLNYRPTEKQRSLLELLQYLTTCVRTPLNALVAADWSGVSDDLKRIKDIPAEKFCDAMDQQLSDVKDRIGQIPMTDFTTKMTSVPWGDNVLLGPALVNLPLKFIAAYRMQLFLYLKGVGNSELSTYSCWIGIDTPDA